MQASRLEDLKSLELHLFYIFFEHLLLVYDRLSNYMNSGKEFIPCDDKLV